jgi:GT2 family glycosyltransferase
MDQLPLVSVIIPHFNGKEILARCLKSLESTTYANYEIILVDNASTDDSIDFVRESYPAVRIQSNRSNRGYAGGCNDGLTIATGNYLVFLNNDTTVAPDWLTELVSHCDGRNDIAACQPKILSISCRDYFDYAGAAGGLIDIFGYPFAKGRILFTIEKDEGQYDSGGDIFWASGTAMFVRRDLFEKLGGFDEDFFAHMEEIDLNWRLQLARYRVISVPSAVVYHQSGSTLQADTYRKLYLNHRNSWIMLLKNYQLHSLIGVVPVRMVLDGLTLVYAVLKLDYRRFFALLTAWLAVVLNLPACARKRRQVRRLRSVSDRGIRDRMFSGSIVWQYFVKNKKTASSLI